MSLSNIIGSLIDSLEKDDQPRVTVGDLIRDLGEKSYLLAITICCIPAFFPLVIIPLGSFFATIIVVFCCQILIGKRYPSLPNQLSRISFNRVSFIKSLKLTSQKLKFIDRLIKPRLHNLADMRLLNIHACLMIISCIFVIIPLPFTNFLPTLGILLIALGLFAMDGLIVVVGYIVSVFGILVAMFVIALVLKTILLI